MLKYIVALILILGASSNETPPEIAKCLEVITLEDLENLKTIPGLEDLAVVCPQLLEMFTCLDDAVRNQIGMGFKEIAEIPDAEISNGAKVFVNTQQVFTELCTAGTLLNSAYLDNAECLSTIDDPLEDCENKAKSAYNSYREFVNLAVTETPSTKERECMVESYKVGCVSTKVMDKCGENAHALYLELIKKTTFLKYGVCSQREIGDLKTKFLDFLELNENHRSLFAQAFDFRRRK